MVIAKLFLSSLTCLLVLDKIWFQFSHSFFMRELANFIDIQNGSIQVRIIPAILVYLLMAFAITYFVFLIKYPKNYLDVFTRGSILGFTAYGVFDLTNLAIMKDYTLIMTLVDISWGTFIFALSSLITFRLNQSSFKQS